MSYLNNFLFFIIKYLSVSCKCVLQNCYKLLQICYSHCVQRTNASNECPLPSSPLKAGQFEPSSRPVLGFANTTKRILQALFFAGKFVTSFQLTLLRDTFMAHPPSSWTRNLVSHLIKRAYRKMVRSMFMEFLP